MGRALVVAVALALELALAWVEERGRYGIFALCLGVLSDAFLP